MIEKYRSIPYVKGGRDLAGLDCWGLVRLVRSEIKGDLLPEFDGVDPLDKRALTKSKESCVIDFNLKQVDIKSGAIACGFTGRLCFHVGIVIEVDGRLFILETDEGTGVVLTSPQMFKSRFSKVEYYD